MSVFSPLTLVSRASRTERIRERHLSRQKSTGRIRHRGVGEGERAGRKPNHTHAHQHLEKKIGNSHWYREKVYTIE